MASRFKIAIESSGIKKGETIPFSPGMADEKMTADLVLKLWDLPEEYRERVLKVIRLCYYSGAQNALTIVKSGKFPTDELLEECKKMVDKGE